MGSRLRGDMVSRTRGATATTASSPRADTIAARTASAAMVASRRSRGVGRNSTACSVIVGYLGTGTLSRISATTSSPVTRRTHSSGRRLSRCASAGTATSFTSSGVT